jgi:hypothetical protein
MIMFIRVSSFTIQADGAIERRTAEAPAITRPAPITVRIVASNDKREVLRLLRRMADELEAIP